MAIVVMILGESGTGKSASLRNFNKEDVALVNVIGKPLPFRQKHFETFISDSYAAIRTFLKKTDKKSIVIDDAQYLMADEFMRRAKEKGFDKFTEIGQNFWSLVNYCSQLPDDVIVYFLQHVETSSDGSTIKAKTIGKLIDEKITLEGMFSIVLRTNVNDGEYCFSTQNSGSDTVKSPVGMFSSDLIPNDLKMVDDHIRQYYDITTTAELMETGGFADAAAETTEQDLKSQEEQSKEFLDINAPHVDIIDDDTPLATRNYFEELKELMRKANITQAELKAVVSEKGIYPADTRVIDYDDDFHEWLVNNFKKIEQAISRKRGK